MKDMGKVQGMAYHAVPLVIGKDTVYVHTDIVRVNNEQGIDIYEYDEIQYDKDEYIQLSTEKMQSDIDYLAIMTGIDL